MDKFKQQCACGREFKQKKNLYAHMRKQHLKEPLETKPKNYECDFCGRKFFCQSSIIRHLRRNHSDTNNKLIGINKKWNLVCPYGKCSKNFRTYEILREHLAEKHDFQIEFEELTFSSVRDFDQWKDSMQLRTLSLYTQCTAARTLRIELGHRLYFNCHRSNVYKHRGNNIRALKSQGSNKIGKACPSRLEVTYTEYAGQIIIKVKFWKTHCGHTNQVERLPLDRQVKCLIAEKLEKGYTFEQIVEWIQASREQDNVTIKRLQLINRKDIHNIIRDLKVKTPKKKRTTTRNEDVKVDKNNISETECDSGNSMLSTFNTKDNIPSSSNGENNIKFDINDSESNVLNINSSESNIQTINNSVDDIFAINISKEYLTTASGSKNNNNIFTISNSKTSISATVGNNNISPKTKSKKDVNSKNNIHKINEELVHKAELFSNIAQVVSLNDQDFLHMKEQIDRLIKRTKLSYSHTKNIVPDLETNKDTTICSNSEHKRNVNEILMNKTELLSKIVKTVSFGVKDAREIEKQIDKLIERAKIQNLDCEKLLQKETQNRVLENT